jgi:poly(3-hydroxybutyrate) depolymerase
MRSYLDGMWPLAWLPLLCAATPETSTWDVSLQPGANFAQAAFRLWLPPQSKRVRAITVLIPGSNQDGRGLVTDPAWQAFAVRNETALLACHFTDRPHPHAFIEEYADVARGSGAALLQALSQLAAAAKRPELGRAPLLLWGFSAGGQFNYEFTAWKPERVLAFVVNKGGVYFTALTPTAARAVPGLLFLGEQDLASRRQVLEGLFVLNRRAGANWALVRERGRAHELGQSPELARMFFEDVMALRLVADELRSVPKNVGFHGDLESLRTQAQSSAGIEDTGVWLPSERMAQAWAFISVGAQSDKE